MEFSVGRELKDHLKTVHAPPADALGIKKHKHQVRQTTSFPAVVLLDDNPRQVVHQVRQTASFSAILLSDDNLRQVLHTWQHLRMVHAPPTNPLVTKKHKHPVGQISSHRAVG